MPGTKPQASLRECGQARPFEAGSLRRRVEERTAHALACGALQPVATESHWIDDAGIRFLVRVLSSTARKDLARAERAAHGTPENFNPFLPHEPDLYVADLSDTHVALLNKFNVVADHLLIITRRFEEQESALGRADFAALLRCLAEYESLGFYNSGTTAGASQRHKHLQLVPLPLAPEGPALPLAPLFDQAKLTDGPDACPGLPFRHAITRVDRPWLADPTSGAGGALRAYEGLLAALDLHIGEAGRLPPYNLLVTRHWMLLIPRSRAAFEGIPVNALGFAGALIARDDAQLQRLRETGPLAILRELGCPL